MVAAAETRSLTKVYGSTIAVRELDLVVDVGEVLGFIGPNGAGKTTTLRMLLDLARPTSGSARIFGMDVQRHSVEIRRRVGYLPGDLALYASLTPAAFFAWIGRVRGRHDPQRVVELCEQFSLDPGRKIADLSSGNRQKVGLVQAVMHRPDLLILDEPTSGLDPVMQRAFHELVEAERSTGTTILLSSHVLTEVERTCDRVATIVDGCLQGIHRLPDVKASKRRHVRLVVDPHADLGPLRHLVELDQQPSAGAGRDRIIEFDYHAAPHDLLAAIAPIEIRDITITPASLETVFLGDHDIVRTQEADRAAAAG